MDTFEISDAFPFKYLMIKERWWSYDKKRKISIYHNYPPICCNNFITS